jgi:molybdenum cofactor biosynthesis protein MoaC
MVDITHKKFTLRSAIAQATVRLSSMAAMEALTQNKVPKGNVFEMAKTAGLFAVKKTSDLIPDCHPLPIEYTKVTYEVNDLEIYISMEVKTVYKTGVEVEAMHGVSVVALTMYDMLKPIDKGISIHDIKLLEKKGGKSEKKSEQLPEHFQVAVISYSTEVHNRTKQDTALQEVIQYFNSQNIQTNTPILIPLEKELLIQHLKQLIVNKCSLIVVVGGTGVGINDNAPETIRPMLQKELPGVMEAARSYGQSRTPYAMLSRGIAGIIDQTLILNIPGSTQGAKETLAALFPSLFHIFQSLNH